MTWWFRAISITAIAGLAGLFAGCERPAEGKDRKYPLRTVTTVGMVSDIVRHVAGDKATVTGLMGEGVDPHLYKPTRDDIAAMAVADVVIYSGLTLEGKLGQVIEKLGKRGKPLYAVAEAIDPSLRLESSQTQGHPDPHVWMDPMRWAQAVEAASRAMQEVDPPNADYYRLNAEAYIAELKSLDAYARAAIETVPPRSRVLITAHDAFSYFGQAYGLEVRGIQGLSTESEAGLKDIQTLVNLIVARDVKAIFIETSVSSKNIRALIEGAGARGRQVKIGGLLYSDAMGPPGTYQGTYIGMIDHNVTTIVRALGGVAPRRGMNGRLGG